MRALSMLSEMYPDEYEGLRKTGSKPLLALGAAHYREFEELYADAMAVDFGLYEERLPKRPNPKRRTKA